jgi:hypothetical protein
VGRVGGVPAVDRALAGILDRERGGDDEDLVGASEAVGFEHHAPEPRVDRQRGQAPADRGQPAAAGAQRAELLE